MNRIAKFGSVFLLCLCWMLTTVRAQTEFWWTNTTGGAWSDAANWTNTAPATGGATNYTLNFINTGNTYTATNDLGVFLLNQLNFNNVAATLWGNGLVLINNGATAPRITQTGNSNVTINTSLVLSNTATFDIGTNGQMILNGTLSGSGGLNKTNTGTLVLTAANTYTGTTTLYQGILNIQSSGALGTGLLQFSIDAAASRLGAIHLQSATGLVLSNNINISGAGTDGTGALRNLSGTNTIAGNLSLIAGAGGTTIQSDAGTLTITGNISAGTTARTLTLQGAGNGEIRGVISDGLTAGLPVTKSGAGTWVLTGANTYTGTTTVSAGTLQIGNGGTNGTLGLGNVIVNANLAFNRSDAYTVTNLMTGTGTITLLGGGTLTASVHSNLSASANLVLGGPASTGNLDLSNFSQTVRTLTAASTNASLTNRITIGTAQTLAVNGNVTIGVDATNITTRLIMNGGGAFVVVTNNGTFKVGGATGAKAYNNALLDMSALGTFTASLGSGGRFQVGDINGDVPVGGTSTLILASNNTVTAGRLSIGDGSQQTMPHYLYLGPGSNVFNVNTIDIGTSDSGRSSGTIQFNSAAGTLVIRDATGTGRAGLDIISGFANTGSGLSGLLDLAGHEADLLLGFVRIAAMTNTANYSVGSRIATLNFDRGIFDATGIEMAVKGGGTGNIISATFNIGGGIVNIGTGGIVMAANYTPNLAPTATVNITGGTVTLNGDIAKSAAGGGPTVASLLLNGGTLDMQGHNLGDGVNPIDNLILQSGTLKNVAQINGGASPLTKTGSGTLYLDGTNTYTSATAINGGLLQFQNTSAFPYYNVINLNAGGALAATFTNLTGAYELLTFVASGSAGMFALLPVQASQNFDYNNIGGQSYPNLILGAATNLTYGGTYTPYQNGGTNYWRLGAITGVTFTYTNAINSGELHINGGGHGGTVVLTANNTLTGAAFIGGGTLQLGAGGTSGSIASPMVTVSNGAWLAFNRSDSITNNIAITGAGGLVQSGNGRLVLPLSNTNTYSGGTVITAGTLQFYSLTNLGSGNITLGGGTLAYANNVGLTFNRAITLTADSTIANIGSQQIFLTGQITDGTGSYGIIKSGNAVYINNSANNYDGSTIVTNGTLYVQSNNSLGTTNGPTIVATNATLSIETQYTTPETLYLNGGTLRTSSGGAAPTYLSWTGNILLGGNSTMSAKYSNSVITVSGNISGNYGLTIGNLGSNPPETGTIVFAGINTYTGPTTVVGGTLTVNGSVLNSAITVQNGGTLGGTGFIAQAVTLNNGANLSPGNSVGTLTVGDLTLTNGVHLLFELGTPGASDLVIVTNALNFSGMDTNWFVFSVVGGFGEGTYTLFDAAAGTMLLGSETNFTNIGGSGLDGYLWLDDAAKDVKLTVVPEPSAATLVFIGLLTMLLVRRRRC